jgi:hypothetical protein
MREKETNKLIPKIYRWNVENLGLFFYIKGQMRILPTMTLDNAIQNYLKFIDSDEWNVESARATYGKLQKEFYECMRDETSKTNK